MEYVSTAEYRRNDSVLGVILRPHTFTRLCNSRRGTPFRIYFISDGLLKMRDIDAPNPVHIKLPKPGLGVEYSRDLLDEIASDGSRASGFRGASR